MINSGKIAIHFTNRQDIENIPATGNPLSQEEQNWIGRTYPLNNVDMHRILKYVDIDRKNCADLRRRIDSAPARITQRQNLHFIISKKPIVIAEYFFQDTTEIYMGEIEDDTQDPSREQIQFSDAPFTGDEWAGFWNPIYKDDGYFYYTTVKVRLMIGPIPRTDHMYWLIRAIKGEGSYHFVHDKKLREIFNDHFTNKHLPIGVNSLIDSQLEVLCHEWLTRHFNGHFKLLMPIGGVQKDVDIFGVDLQTRMLIFAEVTFSKQIDVLTKKAKKLLQYNVTPGAQQLFLFGPVRHAKWLRTQNLFRNVPPSPCHFGSLIKIGDSLDLKVLVR